MLGPRRVCCKCNPKKAETCCETAEADGKECGQACCIEAREAGELCATCNPRDDGCGAERGLKESREGVDPEVGPDQETDMGYRHTALAFALTVGCAAPFSGSAPVVARDISIQARVEAWETHDTFLAVLDVKERGADGTLYTLTMPRVLVRAGEEAKIEIADDGGTPCVRARVRMPALDQLERGARIAVEVFKDGQVVSTTTVNVSVPGPDDTDPAGRSISCSFRSADVHTVLDHFASRLGVDIIAPPGLAGTVTLKLDGVEGRVGLARALASLGFTLEEKGRILRVVPAG